MRSQLRAGLLVLHIVAVLIAALPSTSGLVYRPAWKEVSVQEEFAEWARRLSVLSPDLDGPKLEEKLWTVVTTYAAFHKNVKRPFEPYYTWCGTGQSWQMFPAPQRNPAVLEVEVLRNEKWDLVYRARSAEHPWRRDFFDQDRVRTLTFLMGWPHVRKAGHMKPFVAHLKPWLIEDHPNATRARIRYRRFRTRSPAEVLADEPVSSRFEGTHFLDLRGR